MRKALVFLILLTGCTSEQITHWIEWFNEDPVAATEFANRPEIRENLVHDWDHDGVVEPEPESEPQPEPEREEESQPQERQQESNDSQNQSQGEVWDALAECESGGNWSINTGNGYYGGLQFGMTAWQATGGSGRPDQASRSEQIARAKILLEMQGWGAWPACSRKLGLR